MEEKRLIVSSSEVTLADVIQKELASTQTFIIISAFIGTGLHNMLVRAIENAVSEGKEVKVLTSTMENFNDPKVLRSFQQHASELRIYGNRTDGRYQSAFHVKSYLFISTTSEQKNVIIIGSANFTQSGLTTNKEWNVLLRGDEEVMTQALEEFEQYWEHESFVPDEEFFDRYQARRPLRLTTAADAASRFYAPAIEPNQFQQEALGFLWDFREQHIDKAIVVAATGTGKTYLAAMDFKQSGYGRILFVAHRENILENARKSLENVLGKSLSSSLLTGSTPANSRRPEHLKNTVFAMVSTLSKDEVLQAFPHDYFDYLVVDEFHHAQAATYRKIIDHFTPRFLLGLTATPERMDGRDVFSLCDYNIAYEIRLFEAIEQKLLVPFYYFAIYDEVDYSQIRWTGLNYNSDDLEELLASDTRAQLVLNNLRKFLPAGGVKTKALGFCANTGHARFMKQRFNELGTEAEVVLGDTPEKERGDIISRLIDETDPLEVIFSVDVFTEGVDIPELTHVLLLRPTESFTVFQQQIGRGLRLHKSKDFVIILDFIGNYRTSFIPFLTLRGITAARSVDPYNVPEEPQVPASCFVDEHTEVKKIQEEKIRAIFSRGKYDFYKEIYRQIRSQFDHPLGILELFDHPAVEEMTPFFKFIGENWLRIKEHMGDLSPYEQMLLDTSAEALLQHIEKELKPSKSYKMAVLYSLIRKQAGPEGWDINEIAENFKSFYLQNRRYLNDYTEMSRQHKPEEFPLSKVKAHILKMPLHFLSNTEDKFFTLDMQAERFHLKMGEDGELHQRWNHSQFKQQVEDRITFALKTYFYRKGK